MSDKNIPDMEKIIPESIEIIPEQQLIFNEETPNIAIFATENGTVKVEARLSEGTVWLSQQLLAKLYGVKKQTISYHLKEIFDSGELDENSVVKEFLTTATDGKNYKIKFYNLDVVLHVGYRIQSPTGIMFRKWATERLKEYTIKGFTMDDDRLKYGDGYAQHFEELLQRIRDIRSSEKLFYQKVRDVIAHTSIDYAVRKNEEEIKNFFAHLQDCMLYAVSGNTAAEIKCYRADANKPFMGLTHFRGDVIMQADVDIAKNYLSETELNNLNLLVTMFLDYAETQSRKHQGIHIAEWLKKAQNFLTFNEYPVLSGFGKKRSEQAKSFVREQLKLYRERQSKLIEPEDE